MILKRRRLRGVVFQAGGYGDELQESFKAILQYPAAESRKGVRMSSIEVSLMILNEYEEIEACETLSSRN